VGKCSKTGEKHAETTTLRIKRIRRGEVCVEEDRVVTEYPLTLVVNGEDYLTLLCTPRRLLELAVGHLFSEGIIRSREEVAATAVHHELGRVEVELTGGFSGARSSQGPRRRGSGGGTHLCGAVDELTGFPDAVGWTVGARAVSRLMAVMQERAELFRSTGGAHVAALASAEAVLETAEDIGRHNAVDKLLGYCVLENLECADKLLLCSGRLSSEMVMKGVRGGFPIIVSRSAPTALAVELARELGTTLVGFARNSRMNVYSHAERIEAAG
jgi:FdhD protein